MKLYFNRGYGRDQSGNQKLQFWSRGLKELGLGLRLGLKAYGLGLGME